MKPKFKYQFNAATRVFFFAFLLLSNSDLAHSAACCGGGFGAPSLLVGDEKAQLSSTLSLVEVLVDSVDGQGFWQNRMVHQRNQTLKIEGAHIFQDRWQAGFSLPLIQRQLQGRESSGISDTTLSLGYEYLPDWDYNPYRPKGLGFLQVTLPTGRSKADSEMGGLDSRGNGFWALGIGSLLNKIWGKWDAYSSIEIHRSFAKFISTSSFSGRLIPGYGGNLAVGAGFNRQNFRFGAAITWTYEDPMDSASRATGLVTQGGAERFATALASLSYSASELWAGTFSISDQRLFGNPVNTSLGRGLTLQIQRRWNR